LYMWNTRRCSAVQRRAGYTVHGTAAVS
jgi:hypothetical protein